MNKVYIVFEVDDSGPSYVYHLCRVFSTRHAAEEFQKSLIQEYSGFVFEIDECEVYS